MARKKEISYFASLNTDSELDEFLKKDGLIILDIYQDLFGACSVGLHGSIEKIKIALQDSDALQLASANATTIDKLKRFRGKSKPTMLFCRVIGHFTLESRFINFKAVNAALFQNGKCVDIVYTANMPEIARKVEKHLLMEEYGDNEKAGRYYFEFDELLPEEQAEQDRKNAVEAENRRLERIDEMIKKRAELDEVIEIFRDRIVGFGITISMPHVVDKSYKIIKEHTSWDPKLVTKGHELFKLTPERYEILSYQLGNQLDERILNYIYNKDIEAILWQTGTKTPIITLLKDLVRSISDPQPAKDEDNNPILNEFEPALLNSLHVDSNGEIIEMEKANEQLDEGNEGQKENGNEDEDVKSQESQHEAENNNIQESSLVIPPVWTPSNQAGNSVWMYTLFRNFFDGFFAPVPVKPDPHICMILPAQKYPQAFEIIQKFRKFELIAFGYFRGNNFDDYKLVCKTTKCYENYSDKKDGDLLILKIRYMSKLVIELAPLSPFYISLNPDDGEEECAKIFDDKFENYKDVEEIVTREHSMKGEE